MLIPKKERQAIYERLFNDGVLVALKDFNAPKHSELDVKNLYVIKSMQTLKSKGVVTEKFAWHHYYWYLTDAGIEYLRGFLHLSDEVVPKTLKNPRAARPTGPGATGESKPREGGDRESYRRTDGEKKLGAEADFKPSFQGGYAGAGRGAPRS
eukprot:m.220808 g.220808  ORF g.220808 m.220808 type:complete len:153 (+) comp15652_c0_seq1:385-843(+)